MQLSRYHVATEPFVDERGERKRVIFATRTAESRVIDDRAWRAVEEGALDALPAEVVRELREMELLVSEDENELSTVLDRNTAAAHDGRTLYLVVQPTAWCQLGCGYCGQSHTPRQLSASHQRLFIERARAKVEAGDYKLVEIGWFGGEPLAGMKVVRAMTPGLRAVAEGAGAGYMAKMVTNGVQLSPDIARELVADLGVRHIEITLDGTAPFHDRRRHTKRGGPTFERIFRNLVDLAARRDLDVLVSVRCNVDRHNVEGVQPLLARIAQAGIQERISFYVSPVHSWGNDAHHEALSKEEFAQWEVFWFVEMIKLGLRPGVIPKRRPVVCFSVAPQAELVDANGELFNCTEVSYVPAYGSPNEHAIGHVETGADPLRRQRLQGFNERVRAGRYDCDGCRMLPVCGGCCPKLWEEGIVPCPSTRFNIENRLLIQYAITRLQQCARAAPARSTPGEDGGAVEAQPASAGSR